MLRQAETGQKLARAVLGLRARLAMHLAQRQHHVLQRREVGKKIVALEDEAVLSQHRQRRRLVMRQRPAVHPHLPRVRQQQAAEHAQQGGLTTAARPQQRHHARIAPGGKRRPVQRRERAEPLHHRLRLKSHTRTSPPDAAHTRTAAA